MNAKELKKVKAFAKEFGKCIKTPEDVNDLVAVFKKITFEAALEEEMNEYLGYEKYERADVDINNARNGSYEKTLKDGEAKVGLAIPRDRNGGYEPQIIKKGQRRVPRIDEQVLALYSQGMSTRDIEEFFKDIYDTDISPTFISRVTESVLEKAARWRSRPLEAVYPIVFLDGIVVKVRSEGKVINKTVYIALGISLEGKKECLGLWIDETESASFWFNVLTEIQERGVKDILIACVDGLSGFRKAIETVFPKTEVQLCIVHLVRNSLRYVSQQKKREISQDLKRIYRAATEELAEIELRALKKKWDKKYPRISKIWTNNWDGIIPFFKYPKEVRKIIYTTNTIESLNSVIRKSVSKRKIFAHDNSAYKMLYLIIERASRKWKRPIPNWNETFHKLLILHEDRLNEFI